MILSVSALLDRLFIKQPKFRRLVTRMVYGRSAAVVSLFGADLVVHSELENGYLRASRHARWLSLFRDEAGVLIHLAALIGEDTTFLDIGANIGVFSAVISRLGGIKKNLSVIAFEVDPATFVRLSENARQHGFQAYNFGIGERGETVEYVRGAVSHVTTQADRKNQ